MIGAELIAADHVRYQMAYVGACTAPKVENIRAFVP
jgi:hypothetical protein